MTLSQWLPANYKLRSSKAIKSCLETSRKWITFKMEPVRHASLSYSSLYFVHDALLESLLFSSSSSPELYSFHARSVVTKRLVLTKCWKTIASHEQTTETHRLPHAFISIGFISEGSPSIKWQKKTPRSLSQWSSNESSPHMNDLRKEWMDDWLVG